MSRILCLHSELTIEYHAQTIIIKLADTLSTTGKYDSDALKGGKGKPPASAGQLFRRRFLLRITLSLIIPAFFGLGFLGYLEIFQPKQLLIIVISPLMVSFMIASLLIIVGYFNRFSEPFREFLDDPDRVDMVAVEQQLRRFPLNFWLLFLGYLIIAPAVTIFSGELYADFSPQPVDWFRVHLVALITSIIVGLPIFFGIFDLFGRSLGTLKLVRPVLTVKTRVFLIGALVPLLIDTMLVQYYWTRTGFFTMETFFIWVLLEILAIVGALLSVRSFSFALQPLQSLSKQGGGMAIHDVSEIFPASTDELGIFARELKERIEQQNLHQSRLAFSNKLLRASQTKEDMASLMETAVIATRDSLASDHCFIGLYEKQADELVWVIHSGSQYREQGYGRISAAEDLLPANILKQAKSMVSTALGTQLEYSELPGNIPDNANSAGTPLMLGEEAIGVLLVSRESENNQYSLEDLEILENFAQEIALVIAFFEDQELRKKAESKIRKMAYFDGLTNLPNRELLIDRLGQALAYSGSSGESVIVMLLDLDYFKSINDSLGHSIGDRLLIEVAQRLSSCLRSEDTVARLGGDEFVILLPNIRNQAEALKIATQIAEKVRQTLLPAYELDGNNLVLSHSTGIAISPADGSSAETLIKHADTAMYQAKKKGRDNYQFFSPVMFKAAVERLELESALRLALENDQFEIFYQPKLSVETNRIIGSEALIRWRRPGKGLICPDQFIPIANETGLIVPIGSWVLEESCEMTKKFWCDNRRCERLQSMSVNVSMRQFAEKYFVKTVRSIIGKTGLKPSCIELELTEDVLAQDINVVREKLYELKEYGVKISIDDFGTGYSSLRYLQRLPIDIIKIDRSFIKNLGENESDAKIVETILSMARHLGKYTIAEGVETEEQLDFLRKHGCDAYQGFLRSKPMPSDSFSQFLDEDFDR